MAEHLISVFIAIVSGCISSSLGMWLVKRSRKKKSIKARDQYGNGKTVSIWAMSLGLGFLRSQWVAGTLEIEPGVITFYESLKLPETKGKRLEADIVQLGETHPLEEKVALRIHQKCEVLPIEMNGRIVEIAVLPQDAPLVRAALKPSANLSA